MADDIDKANDLAEMERNAAIQRARQATGNEVLTGMCQNDCGETCHGAFCSASCRTDFNKRMRLRNG